MPPLLAPRAVGIVQASLAKLMGEYLLLLGIFETPHPGCTARHTPTPASTPTIRAFEKGYNTTLCYRAGKSSGCKNAKAYSRAATANIAPGT